ncbi:hypothetical protein U2G91_15680 [Rhodococcoides fascians]|uniref:hypothetical protein n=1 Tax=Rhodococcoides fascians TaxID=1828 RepID=UPI002ACDCEB0|nr:hypothetical protein [Rhodococcus fascians]WQH26543.1 hypothetical protein U2G91_15680 [Rhodococcus fascians]
MSSEVFAPWTDEQVHNLNEYQRAGVMHPFTCFCEAGKRDMIATNDGWACPNDACDIDQKWAHAFMADGSVLRDHQVLMDNLFRPDPERGRIADLFGMTS